MNSEDQYIDYLIVYWIIFLYQFFNNFTELLLCSINVLLTYNIVDFKKNFKYIGKRRDCSRNTHMIFFRKMSSLIFLNTFDFFLQNFFTFLDIQFLEKNQNYKRETDTPMIFNFKKHRNS